MVGDWIREQRNRLGQTRAQFARCVGCSVAMLRKIEDGERHPSVQIAGLIANCLGISPDDRLTFVRIARGELSIDRLPRVLEESGGPGRYPPRDPARKPLPVAPTPLVGRAREMDQLCQLLGDPQCRLLTLTGPGGIGKTRLAIEVATCLEEYYMGSVYFASFAPVDTTRYLVPLIAEAIGFSFESTHRSDPKTQLFNYLREKQALIILDNLEQLLAEPGIELLSEMLIAARGVKLLATSREPLKLSGEWIFEVQGLPIPDSPSGEGGLEGTSVDLFLRCARRANVRFAATPDDYPAIVRICRQVDGVPLAIELAAAWVRTLSCQEITREIDLGVDFLSYSGRDLPPRHRTMRAVIDHSWRLLTEEERKKLLQLSVFRGGFHREAGEAVTGATLSMLSNLMEKSLIQRHDTGRYDLHQLIWQYAVEKFAQTPKEQAETRANHSQYYLARFGEADRRLRSAEQPKELAGLSAEIDNFRSAWDWAVEQGDFDIIEPALRTYAYFMDIRGWYQEGVEELERARVALETSNERHPLTRGKLATLAHLLTSEGFLASRLARSEQAKELLERALGILRNIDEPQILIETLTFLGVVMEVTGQYPRAAALYLEGMEIARALGDRWFAALGLLGHTDMIGLIQGAIEPVKIYDRFKSTVTELRSIGDPRFTAIGLNALSVSALSLGRVEEARFALEESITLSSATGDRWALGFAYRGLGVIAETQGDYLQSVEIFQKSLAVLKNLGARQDVAHVLAEMARSILTLGDEAEAERIWREALQIANETGGVFIALDTLVGLAGILARQGKKEQALEYILLAVDHPAIMKITRDRAGSLRTELEKQLTDRQVEAISAQAGRTPLETAIDEILSGLDRVT